MTQSQHSSRHPSNASSAASLPGLASLRLAGCIPRHRISPGSPAPRQGCRKVLVPPFLASPHRPAGLRVLLRGEPTRKRCRWELTTP